MGRREGSYYWSALWNDYIMARSGYKALEWVTCVRNRRLQGASYINGSSHYIGDLTRAVEDPMKR